MKNHDDNNFNEEDESDKISENKSNVKKSMKKLLI